MAESKRTFQAAKIDRDLDERLVQPGSYKDALNISVASSEDANVGSAENLKGNNLIDNLHNDIDQDITGLSSSSNPNAEIIGSYAHPDENKIYYFVSGDNGDGIFEYDVDNNKVNTIILDGSAVHVPDAGDADEDEEPDQTDDTVLPEFKFSFAKATATVSISGKISIFCERGIAESLTDNFNEYVSTDTARSIRVKVKVPLGYSNTHQYVYGTVDATQQATPSQDIFIDDVTSLTTTTATLNAYFEENYNLTEVGFYYAENTGGSTSYEYFATKFEIAKRTQFLNKQVVLGDGDNNPFTGVPSSDVVVIDGENNEISSSQYEYIEGTEGQPSILKAVDMSEFESFPITVGKVSSKTTVTTGKTAAQLATGTKRVVENTAADIVSPYSLDISSLTAGTDYAVIAYATNSAGTSYSNVLTFTTQTALQAAPVLVNNKLFVVPSTNNGAYANVGYGDFFKSNRYAYTVFSTSSSGKFIKTGDVGNLDHKVIRSSGDYTTALYNNATFGLQNADSSLDTPYRNLGSAGTIYSETHGGLSEGDDLTEPIPSWTMAATFSGAPAQDTNSVRITLSNFGGETTVQDFISAMTGITTPIITTTGPTPQFFIISSPGSINHGVFTLEMNSAKNKMIFIADRLWLRKKDDVGEAVSFEVYFGLGANQHDVKYIDGLGKWETGVDYQFKGRDNNVGASWPRKVQSFTLYDNLVPNNSVSTIRVSSSDGEFFPATFQIVKGTPSETLYTSSFSLTYAKTGSGTTPYTGYANYTQGGYTRGYTPGTYKIGPFEDLVDGVAVIPVANATFDSGNIKAWSGNFDKSKLTISISGKTEGTDYEYFVVDEAPGWHGNGHLYKLETVYKAPAVIIKANPSILNNGTASVTHAVTITYAY